MSPEQARAAARDLLNEIHDCRRAGLLPPTENEAAAIILRNAAPATDGVREALEDARKFIDAAPEATWGYHEGHNERWPLKAELLHNIDKALSASPSSEAKGETLVPKGSVVQRADGTKYVARKGESLPHGATIVASTPHGDGDFSYICGHEYCRCFS